MSKSRIRISAFILAMLLIAVIGWQSNLVPRTAQNNEDAIVELLPYSKEWKLSNNQEAILILAYVPDETTESRKALLAQVAKDYQGRVRFAHLNLTRTYGYGSNTVYATIFDINQTSAFILKRNGESTFEKLPGGASEAELKAFIESALKASSP